jgi:mRNA-degrading endonuclease RelE of RelBE toxin-antitoxin system
MYKVSVPETFRKEVENLKNKNLEQIIYKKLKTLEEDADKYPHARHELREYRKLRIGKLRILYEIVGDVVYPKKLIKRHKY